MSRNLDDLLDYEICRRPALAGLVAKLDHLTEAEIAAADVPLPWIRKALLARKRDRERRCLAVALEPWVIDGHLADPVGEMRRWEASDTFLRVGTSQLEIQYGQLIWFEANGAVWIDSIRSQMIDPLLMQHTVSCGHVQRSAYLAAVRARARQLVPHETTPTPMERVRFYRPK